MDCRYCRAWNADEEHRCRRCGRRLHAAPGGIGPAPYAHGALAEQVMYAPAPAAPPAAQPEVVARTEPAPDTARRSRSVYQRPLFGTSDMGPVLPFEAFTPPEKPARPRSALRPRVRRPAPPGQHTLDFNLAPAPATARRGRAGESVVYCDARAATLQHRAIAAVLDLTMIAIALGLFTGILVALNVPIAIDKQSAPFAGTVVAAFILFYRVLWCLGNNDSPGLRWMQLRLVNLEGRSPARTQRFQRLFSGWLSVLAAGLGLLWALADEESLTWHDHISKTFPTTH